MNNTQLLHNLYPDSEMRGVNPYTMSREERGQFYLHLQQAIGDTAWAVRRQDECPRDDVTRSDIAPVNMISTEYRLLSALGSAFATLLDITAGLVEATEEDKA